MKTLKVVIFILTIILILNFDSISNNWEQIGQEMTSDDQYKSDVYQYDINFEGNKVAICYKGLSKKAMVLGLKNNKWEQIGKNINSENYFEDICLSNDNVFISSEVISDNGFDRITSIRILKNNNNDWIEEDKIIGDNENKLNGPIKVNRDGNLIVIAQQSSKPHKESLKYYDEIVAYRKINGMWKRIDQKIQINTESRIDKTLSLSGDGKMLIFNTKNKNGKYSYYSIEVYKVNVDSFEKLHSYKTEQLDLYSTIETAISGNGEYILVGFPDYYANGADMSDFENGKLKVLKITDNKLRLIGNEIIGNKNNQLGRKISINNEGNIISAISFTKKMIKPYNLKYYELESMIRIFKLKNDKWEEIGNNLNGKDVILNGEGNIIASKGTNKDIKVYKFKKQ